MKRWLIVLALTAAAAAQTHTYPALDTNNGFVGSNTFGLLNGVQTADGVKNLTIGAANAAAITQGGGTVVSPEFHDETATAGLTIGSATVPVHLIFENGSTYTCALLGGGTCLTESTLGRISGDGVTNLAIVGSGNQIATSLITNTSSSEFYQFDHFQYKTITGDLFSPTACNGGQCGAMEIEGGFAPSFIDNVVGTCENVFTVPTPCFHLTSSAFSGSSEAAGDSFINESWFNCVNFANCQPVVVTSPLAGKVVEAITFLNDTIEHPGPGYSPFTADGTTGAIVDLRMLDDRFEGNSTDGVTPLVTLNNVDSAHFLYPWFAPDTGNPPWVSITGISSMVTILGAQSFTSGQAVNNAATGRIITGQNYLPIYLSAPSGNSGVIEVSPFIFSSPGDHTLAMHFNSGATLSEQTDTFFDDQNLPQWDLQKASNENLQILDSQNSSMPRLVFGPGSFTNINSGGSQPVNVNANVNSGTGGLVVGDGGATPDLASIRVFPGVPSGACANTSLGINAGAATNSTVLYVCVAGSSSWNAVTVP